MRPVIIFSLLVSLLTACVKSPELYQIKSPNGSLMLTFDPNGKTINYSLKYLSKPLILPSQLGLVFKEADTLAGNIQVSTVTRSTFDETWELPWGESRHVRNHYNELKVELKEIAGSQRNFFIVFRLFDDGIGFRYEVPNQNQSDSIYIIDELTQFALADNYKAWWIPAYRNNRYEFLYQQSPISALDTVHTPLTIEAADSLYLCIHEANLTNYGAMTLASDKQKTLKCDIVPWADGVKVKTKTPFQTPWRTIQIATTPGGLITSNLVLNLNEPNCLGDISWIKPQKYIGIWWGMHIEKYTWGSGPKHGATTKNTKAYIDFAADNGFSGVLVEGWNLGWEEWKNYNFVQPYPDFDINYLTKYADSKGVKIIGHHETGADVANYERQLDTAFSYYHSLGINAVKTGYVGSRHDGKEWHHGQKAVNHYRRVVETAAKYHIMLDVHEPIKETGLRRTYPNLMTQEGARGMEYNAWDANGGNPPAHETILPFTRLLSGPMDFTPGIFDINIPEKPKNQVNTTLAKQLALYVVLYSPLQMAADLPEHYKDQPALQFIKDVVVDWDTTVVINGKIGQYVTIVRKDRHSNDWFLGSITNELPRDFELNLDFLPENQRFEAQIYQDGKDADFKVNPLSIEIFQKPVNKSDKLQLKLAAGGGVAIRFKAL